jgi:hypothetical protein
MPGNILFSEWCPDWNNSNYFTGDFIFRNFKNREKGIAGG